MDYELGSGAPPGWYWDVADAGKLGRRYAELYKSREENPLWGVLKDRLAAGAAR